MKKIMALRKMSMIHGNPYEKSVDLVHVCTIKDKRLIIEEKNGLNKYFTVSSKNSLTGSFCKTKYDILKEKKRHLEQKYFVIHPLSEFHMYWSAFLVTVYFISLFVIPIEILDQMMEYSCEFDGIRIITLIVDLIGILDIIKRFFTGIPKIKKGKIYLTPKQIIKGYLKSLQCYVDIITCIPMNLFCELFSENQPIWHILALTSIVKALRVKRILQTLDRLAAGYLTDSYNFAICLGLVALWLHWTACLLPALPLFQARSVLNGKLSNNSWLVREDVDVYSLRHTYLTSIFWATAMFLCIRHSDLEFDDSIEVFTLMACFICGYIINAIFFVFFLQMIHSFRSQSLNYEAMTNQLSKYMSYRQLSIGLQEKMLLYYEHKFKSIYFREGKLMSVLSDQLCKEINIFSHLNLMKSVNILHRISDAAVNEIVGNLKVELFLPNDVIMKAGTEGDCMYFLSYGTVAAFTPMGKEICHFTDGSYFGEVELIRKDNKRIFSVIAIEICEAYRLERKDFKQSLENEVETYRYLEKVALDRVTNAAFLEELHKKHILERNMAVNYTN